MVKELNYLKCNEIKHITLEGLYSNDKTTLDGLDYNLEAIIETEAPLTYNTLKERLREAFGVAKISSKALDIILSHLSKFQFEETDNLYDKTIWSSDGVHEMSYVRINSNRQIYDIPHEEMKPICKYFMNNGLNGEPLYREILKYFGYEVLTKKALDYLSFVEEMSKE